MEGKRGIRKEEDRMDTTQTLRNEINPLPPLSNEHLLPRQPILVDLVPFENCRNHLLSLLVQHRGRRRGMRRGKNSKEECLLNLQEQEERGVIEVGGKDRDRRGMLIVRGMRRGMKEGG